MKPREYYLSLLHAHIKNPKMIAHSLAAEAVMRALARKFEEDEDVWGMAGLLHDIDVEWTEADPLRHGPEGAAFLQKHDIPAEVTEAIRLHNERAAGGEKRSTRLHHALAGGNHHRIDLRCGAGVSGQKNIECQAQIGHQTYEREIVCRLGQTGKHQRM